MSRTWTGTETVDMGDRVHFPHTPSITGRVVDPDLSRRGGWHVGRCEVRWRGGWRSSPRIAELAIIPEPDAEALAAERSAALAGATARDALLARLAELRGSARAFIAAHSPDLMGAVWEGLADEVRSEHFMRLDHEGRPLYCACCIEAEPCPFVLRWCRALGVEVADDSEPTAEHRASTCPDEDCHECINEALAPPAASPETPVPGEGVAGRDLAPTIAYFASPERAYVAIDNHLDKGWPLTGGGAP